MPTLAASSSVASTPNICGADVSNSIDRYGPLGLAQAKCDKASYVKTGVGFYFDPIKDQRLELVVANSSDTFDKNQDQPMLGFIYTGKVAGGLFEPRATFHVIPKREIKVKGAAGATKKAAQDTVWNIGGDVKYGDLGVKLDYVQYATGDQTATGTKPGDDTTSTLAGRVSYRIDAFEPIFIVESSTDEDKKVSGVTKSTVKTDSLGLTAALHFYPTSWKKFRFHAAYSTYSKKADTSGAKEEKTDTFLIGTALVSDVPVSY